MAGSCNISVQGFELLMYSMVDKIIAPQEYYLCIVITLP